MGERVEVPFMNPTGRVGPARPMIPENQNTSNLTPVASCVREDGLLSAQESTALRDGVSAWEVGAALHGDRDRQRRRGYTLDHVRTRPKPPRVTLQEEEPRLPRR